MRICFRGLQSGAYAEQLPAADVITATLDTGELPNDGWTKQLGVRPCAWRAAPSLGDSDDRARLSG
jgi:hypothetical protein